MKYISARGAGCWSVDFEASYSIAARTTPGNGPVEYQWQLNGNDLSNGTTTTTVNTAASGQLEVIDANGRTVDVVDFSQVSTYSGPNKRAIIQNS